MYNFKEINKNNLFLDACAAPGGKSFQILSKKLNVVLNDKNKKRIQILKTNLISEREYQKLQNQFENDFVNSNSSISGIANSLARYYMLYGDVNLINNEIDIYRSITREEIRDVANKYLKAEERALLEYLPKKEN